MTKPYRHLHENPSDGELAQAMARLRAKKLPIRKSGVLAGLTGGPNPELQTIAVVLWLDAPNRPDLTDLARVHMTDGEGNFKVFYESVADGKGQAVIGLYIVLSSPVEVTIPLIFETDQEFELLLAIIDAGAICIDFTPPDQNGIPDPRAVSVEFDAVMVQEMRQHIAYIQSL